MTIRSSRDTNTYVHVNTAVVHTISIVVPNVEVDPTDRVELFLVLPNGREKRVHLTPEHFIEPETLDFSTSQSYTNEDY